MADLLEPKCASCEHLSRDMQFEEWDCDHPERPPRKSTATPRDPAAPVWCPLRTAGGVEMGRRGQLEDMMGYLAEAGSALERAYIAAKNAELIGDAPVIDGYRQQLLQLRRDLTLKHHLEV